jgi:general secretion pathway protein J
MRQRLNATQMGFTLIEVLVAIMVLALMATLAWRGVDGIVRARTRADTQLERILKLNTVLAQWEQDLGLLQETPAVLPLSFDGASLRLTRQTPQGMQLVVWSLVPDPDAVGAGGAWVRWASVPFKSRNELQEAWIKSQQLGDSHRRSSIKTLSGILQWNLYAFRNNGWSNIQSSGDQEEDPGAEPEPATPPPAPGSAASAARRSVAPRREKLPSAVRLVLGFAPGSGYSGNLVRDIALGPQQP